MLWVVLRWLPTRLDDTFFVYFQCPDLYQVVDAMTRFYVIVTLIGSTLRSLLCDPSS